MAEEQRTVTLRLPSTLSAYSGGKSQIALQASTVEELLAQLKQHHPSIWECLCTEQGQVKQHVTIFVNNEVIRDTGNQQISLKPGQEVIVLPTFGA
ncbi:molybdenum cofactor biosynthesis protein MoaD [Ktedonobacter sp. SOSP1-85]|jgi:molybdopterin synthase sulfur carrier subunit|uniref:Molybdenum cofactor biosynthesis protein MoaD n=1 Tax=Ktedonobacter robiniae TaxID=2778365 RepID=A0ABQ3URA9_9CHLR|nr:MULTISPECIES: MoaD/ThiS family protein [Ktedonobacter]GHO55271.1 molybdenum cofactor biosynthesis protein MoaD [Ktedonobacter robiniae]GHO67612.1 molybdenum cofactor biosynthesis protein MoaD [Ktedonobacter sp. SOSP1-52]GHO73109.1 molybdenum cofactor biosynthesis protein MoaD [Ktedonobacter sp. SOSP1-85]